MNKTILFLITILLFSNCRIAPTAIPKKVVLSIEKTSCFGTCPVFKLVVFDDGSLTLNAIEYLKIKGDYQSQLSEEQLQKLISDFVNGNFFEFEDSYTANITDYPTTYIEFNHQGQSKKIMDYYGAPESLKVLEEKLSSLIDEQDWHSLLSK